MSKHITAHSVSEAWDLVNQFFPGDYEKDDHGSATAGYPIYRSTGSFENAWYNYICDLGTRLEINLCNEKWQGETINIEIVEPDPAPTVMNEYLFTVGLFDKDTERQEIPTSRAHDMLADILIEKHGVYAYTMIDCSGVYKMQSTGRIVREPSIRIEIVTDMADLLDCAAIIADIKSALNQETVMLKKSAANVSFI